MDHIIEAAAPAKYKHIDFKPPEGVRKAAKRGLEMRKEHGRGGTAVGVARARDLMNGKTISPSTARRMKAYFDRHQPDQKAEGFDSGEDGYPSAGRVAWLLWGGDAGYAWAKKLVKQMNSADEKGKVKPSSDEWKDVDAFFSRNPDIQLDFHVKGQDAIEIEMFKIPKDKRRQGEGTRTYKEFEAALPSRIKRIDIYAADTGSGPSDAFWDILGFEYKYSDEGDEGADWNEVKNWMFKKVRSSADDLEKAKLNVQAMAQAHWGSESFRKWFGNSKVVDKNGKPLVKQMNAADGKVSASATTRTYYHGGAKRYSRLLPSKGGVFGAGLYLTTDKKAAERYARSAPGAENGGAITEVKVTVDPEKVWSIARRYDLRDFTDAPWLAELIEKYGEGAAIKDGMNAAVYLFGNDTSKIKDLGYQALQTRSASPTDHDLLVLDDSIISYPNDSGVIDEEVLASFKLRTPTGIPGLRDDDDHDSGYGDFTAALFGALSREKVMDLVEMVGVRMLRALAGPALNGSLKRLLPSLTDSFNIGRKVPITEQEVLSLALRQAKDAARMGLSARHKALLSEVKSVLESELRGKELPPGDSSMKVPEATDAGDEMYEHLSRRSVKASPCGCDSGCACSTPQNSSGQPPSDMTISNLKQIVRDASELLGLLHENMELMGWAEDKITQAKVAVDSVKNYVLTDFGHEASEAVVLTVAAAKKPWEEKREPEGKLSKRWREEAEKRAKKAGRKYPNQVDNMWAKQQQNEARASVAAALLSAADVLSRGGER